MTFDARLVLGLFGSVLFFPGTLFFIAESDFTVTLWGQFLLEHWPSVINEPHLQNSSKKSHPSNDKWNLIQYRLFLTDRFIY